MKGSTVSDIDPDLRNRDSVYFLDEAFFQAGISHSRGRWMDCIFGTGWMPCLEGYLLHQRIFEFVQGYGCYGCLVLLGIESYIGSCRIHTGLAGLGE